MTIWYFQYEPFDLSGLDIEGIFRKAPSKVLQREIKGRFDAGETAQHLSVHEYDT